MSKSVQKEIDSANQEFWNEIFLENRLYTYSYSSLQTDLWDLIKKSKILKKIQAIESN